MITICMVVVPVRMDEWLRVYISLIENCNSFPNISFLYFVCLLVEWTYHHSKYIIFPVEIGEACGVDLLISFKASYCVLSHRQTDAHK